MKKVFLLLMLVSFLSGDNYEGKTIFVSIKDKPVYELLEILKKKGKLIIVYSREQLMKKDVPLTININLRSMSAGRILEIASKAAGFGIERHEQVYIILPYRERQPEKSSELSKSKKQAYILSTSEQQKEDKKRKKIEILDISTGTFEISERRYTGTFMFGEGKKIYLNLVIPTVNEKEKMRITNAMKKAVRDGRMTNEEAESLFGLDTDIMGTEAHLFIRELFKALTKNLKDGELSDIEINNLRNDFINQIVRHYEGAR